MEDHRLKSFCLVVETKSFSRAAQAKHMTQSAMSRLIKGLEDELGVMLLLRSGKAVTPTAEGKVFYDHARKILAEYALLDAGVGKAVAASGNRLRLGVSRVPAQYLAQQVLYDFSRRHPDVEINLAVSGSPGVLQDLRSGKIEIGIVELAVADRGLVVEPFADDELVLIAPENHRLAASRPVALADLAAEPLLLPDPEADLRPLIDGLLAKAGKTTVRMTVGDPALLVQMVRTGLGIAFASRWSAFPSIKDGTIRQVKFRHAAVKRRFSLVHRGDCTGAAALFRSFLLQSKPFLPL